MAAKGDKEFWQDAVQAMLDILCETSLEGLVQHAPRELVPLPQSIPIP